MSTVNRKHEIFVKEMILHGDQQKAYQAAYPKASPETARKNSYKLLQNPTISDKIKKVKDEEEEAVLKARRAALIKAAQRNALTAIEKREKLRRIIDGEQVDEFYVVVKGEVKRVTRAPKLVDIMKAIEIDSKLAGHFVEKVDLSVDDKFVEALKLIASSNKGGQRVHS